jgi:hypothetical protein
VIRSVAATRSSAASSISVKLRPDDATLAPNEIKAVFIIVSDFLIVVSDCAIGPLDIPEQGI